MATGGYADESAVLHAFDGSPGIQIVVRSTDLQVVAANRGARECLDRSDLVGLRLPELRAPGVQVVVTALSEVARTGVPFHENLVPVVTDWSGRSGGRWIDLRVSPWLDASGNVVGAVAAGVDVTEHVRAAGRERARAAEADELLARAREVTGRLQGALLPATVPLLPRLDVAASYLLARPEQDGGAGWFDTASLSDGRVALAAGHLPGGVEASAATSELRTVLAARLSEGAGVLEALEAAEAYAERVGLHRTTACIAFLDPRSGELEYATFGHPTPLVVGPDGTRSLPAASGRRPASRSEQRVLRAALRDGEAIVLYADGREGGPGQDAFAPLHVATGGVWTADSSVAADLCRDVSGVLTAEGRADDVTVLVAHRRTPPAPLDLVVPAEARQLAPVRGEIEAWARGVGLGDRDRAGLVLGVSEAAANAVEHAYGTAADAAVGTVEIHAAVHDDATVEVVVRDHGRWHEPPSDPGDRGRGFPMMLSAGLQVRVVTGSTGTAVTLRCPARRPVSLAQADAEADDGRPQVVPLAGR
ncbi:ATP-binding SpoIIE family protein phosphatase [Cellulomonas fengjieae]|uniref:SpoIIE family protein phosphatase n=1 Tax=Cellulomonas fengjieae TaxID=2819978 RepID=A0ABS3SIR8_9CELL|nr:SpoIIE family protein phosphatase [Cellulomonas fengjieae]MBO3085643.1 SpoIIE family protein phosphatase [Cellulomonas fengjieae]QVI67642.1 SpoIIE family protein phosphatase [Cellulomonas fengjieae]